jgi:small-conductance mechanosensitive channel
VRPRSLGAVSLDFEVRASVRSLDEGLRVRHAINAWLEQALREHGIRFPP